MKAVLGIKGADCVATVDRDEVDRLRKRFMKLDKVCCFSILPNLLLAMLSIHAGQFGNDRTRRVPLTSSSLIESSSDPVLDLHPMTPTAQGFPRLINSHCITA